MNKLLKRITAIILTMAVVCLIGCKKADEPNNGGNNGNNGGSDGETPEAPAIVSTSEVQYEGKVFVEAVFEDETKMYFTIVSPTEVSVVSGEFYYLDNPSLAYQYRGEVVIPETISHLGTTYTVVAIGYNAFFQCDLVTAVYIPNTIVSIDSFGDNIFGYGSFQGCTNLNSIHLSDNLQIIGHETFEGCPCFSDTVTIPNSITSIGMHAFDSRTVVFNADSCFIAGGLLPGKHVCQSFSRTLCLSAFPNMSSISFGANVKVLPAYLFSTMNPSVVDIPSTITIIADDVFYHCYNLSSIDVPNSVVEIGNRAFQNCYNLATIHLPNSLKRIGNYAFAYSPSIETAITCMSVEPPFLGENVFESRHIEAIYVPTASVDAYKTADGWSQYADVIVGI